MRILFVTWDGPQVSYLEGLFVPIFAGLAERDVHFDVLQFRWGDPRGTDRARTACEAAGIGYRAVKVLRAMGPAGPMLTALAGGRHVRKAVRTFGSDCLMPRCLMPAIAVRAAGGNRLGSILFDADGLPADERVDFGADAASSLTYRLLRRAEAWAVRNAAAVLVRTPAGGEILAQRTGVDGERFHVVANGRDGCLFHPHDPAGRRTIRDALGIAADAPLVLFAGSIGPKFRFDLIRDFAGAVSRRRPDARLLVLTGSPELAGQALGANPPLSPIVLRVAPEEIPGYIAAADLGLSLIRDTFSTRAVSPIKTGEYLMCGVPVFGTAAVGPTRAAADAGVFLDESVGVDEAARWLTEEVLPAREEYRTRARSAGVASFSLQRSIADYLGAIEAVSGVSDAVPGPSSQPR